MENALEVEVSPRSPLLSPGEPEPDATLLAIEEAPCSEDSLATLVASAEEASEAAVLDALGDVDVTVGWGGVGMTFGGGDTVPGDGPDVTMPGAWVPLVQLSRHVANASQHETWRARAKPSRRARDRARSLLAFERTWPAEVWLREPLRVSRAALLVA